MCRQRHGTSKRQAVDSAFIKANASMDSLVEKEIIENDAENYVQEFNEHSEEKINFTKQKSRANKKDKSKKTITSQRKKYVDQHHAWKEKEFKNQPSNKNSEQVDEHGNLIRPKYLSIHIHESKTDSDARISVKPGKTRQLNYFGQIAVDDAHHVITGACSDFVDKRDSQCLENILEITKENLLENEISLDEITADTDYSSGEALNYLAEKNIDAYIPNFGQYKNEREGFVYNQEKDQYECQRGNQAILVFKGERTDSKGYTKKTYRSSETVCKNCPLRAQCCGKTTKFKKIDDSIHKPLYDQMHKKMQSPYAKRMSRIRSKTVEPVLGILKNFLNIQRVNTRGIEQANKHVLMAALCYNLKKLMKLNRPKLTFNYQQLEIELKKAPKGLEILFLRVVTLYRCSQQV